MITHTLLQGTQPWHTHRATHLNASDAPAVMGQSSYKSRNQLIKERSTGIVPEVDAATQRRFDDGHRFEAMARPLAELVIGEELYPVTGSLGKYSASYDGLTMGEDIGFEHKSLNDTLRSIMVDGCTGADLPMEYQIQMEQQCLVADCDKVLFMASKWDGDALIEERHCWYEKNMFLRKQIVDAWTQFEADLAAYTHIEPAAKPEVDVQAQLPAVVINVTGQLSASNLDSVTPKFDAYLTGTKTELATDSDFANGESNAKFSRATAKALKTKAKEVVDQIASISDAVRTLELYAGKFDALGLKLEKAVKEQKELIKTNLINEARDRLREHCEKLDERIGKRYLPIIQGNWNEVVKNKRTIESLRNAIDTELARAKIELSGVADRIQINLNLLKALDAPKFLFSDIATICVKDNDDFAAVAKQRISEHEALEAARLAAETARIAEEERVKAEAKAREELEQQAQDQAANNVRAQREKAEKEQLYQAAQASPAAIDATIDDPVRQPVPSGFSTHSLVVNNAVDPLTGAHKRTYQRASTRSLVDNILAGLPEADLQQVLTYLQSRYPPQQAA